MANMINAWDEGEFEDEQLKILNLNPNRQNRNKFPLIISSKDFSEEKLENNILSTPSKPKQSSRCSEKLCSEKAIMSQKKKKLKLNILRPIQYCSSSMSIPKNVRDKVKMPDICSPSPMLKSTMVLSGLCQKELNQNHSRQKKKFCETSLCLSPQSCLTPLSSSKVSKNFINKIKIDDIIVGSHRKCISQLTEPKNIVSEGSTMIDIKKYCRIASSFSKPNGQSLISILERHKSKLESMASSNQKDKYFTTNLFRHFRVKTEYASLPEYQEKQKIAREMIKNYKLNDRKLPKLIRIKKVKQFDIKFLLCILGN